MAQKFKIVILAACGSHIKITFLILTPRAGQTLPFCQKPKKTRLYNAPQCDLIFAVDLPVAFL